MTKTLRSLTLRDLISTDATRLEDSDHAITRAHRTDLLMRQLQIPRQQASLLLRED